MEKSIEDLILYIESEKSKQVDFIRNTEKPDENPYAISAGGKIFAFDFCLRELQRLLSNQKNELNHEKRHT